MKFYWVLLNSCCCSLSGRQTFQGKAKQRSHITVKNLGYIIILIWKMLPFIASWHAFSVFLKCSGILASERCQRNGSDCSYHFTVSYIHFVSFVSPYWNIKTGELLLSYLILQRGVKHKKSLSSLFGISHSSQAQKNKGGHNWKCTNPCVLFPQTFI